MPQPLIPTPSSHTQAEPAPKHPRHAVYASEATGLILIALLLLILTLVRYWHHFSWSLR